MDGLETLIRLCITLIVISLLLGESPFTRFALHLFLGVSVAFVAFMVFRYGIYLPYTSLIKNANGLNDESITLLGGLVLCSCLLSKLLSKQVPLFSRTYRLVIAMLVGVGVAAALAGAIKGTLIPQMMMTINAFPLGERFATQIKQSGADEYMWIVLQNMAMISGVISVLVVFRKKPDFKFQQDSIIKHVMHYVGTLGKYYLALTFGVLYGNVFLTALYAFVEQVHWMWEFISSL